MIWLPINFCRYVAPLAIMASAQLCIAALSAREAAAQTIYPLDRAEILVGSRFDLKVEFDGPVAAGDVKVTIDGKDASAVLGVAPEIIEKEEGNELTAFWLRNAAFDKPATYAVEASAGGKSAKVTWEVFGTPERKSRNVILLIGDGLSLAHRNAARMMSKGISQGRYGGELAMDDMPHMALVSTAGSDSIITDSANSASAYTTGHKSCVNALGVYCARNKATLAHPRVENITELVKRRHNLAVGIVTDTEIQDATPASMVAHTRRRTDYDDIVEAFDKLKPEVVMGGGWPNFLPKSHPAGKRADEDDYINRLMAAGYTHVRTATALGIEAGRDDTKRLLGLFNPRNIDGALDRKILKKGTVTSFPDQPDLTDQTRAALQILQRHDNGFMLMVEAGRIDKYSHSLDWERAVYDTIMFDNVVRIAKEFAAQKNDTLVLVVADHTHPAAIIGTYADAADGSTADQQPRDRLRLYDSAGFPNYGPPDAEGYPPSVDVSQRLAFVFAAYPDHCDAGRPFLAGENKPAVLDADKKVATANPELCSAPGIARRVGNLPFRADRGIHSGEDVILTAMGPGAELVRGRMDNTRVFRIMATALGLGGAK